MLFKECIIFLILKIVLFPANFPQSRLQTSSCSALVFCVQSHCPHCLPQTFHTFSHKLVHFPYVLHKQAQFPHCLLQTGSFSSLSYTNSLIFLIVLHKQSHFSHFLTQTGSFYTLFAANRLILHITNRPIFHIFSCIKLIYPSVSCK